MAIEYKYEIQNMEVSPSEGGLENVVKKVNWMYSGTEDGDGIKYFGCTTGTFEIDSASADSFTSFNDLTEEQIKGWIQSQIDEAVIKTDIDSQIETQKNPPIVVKSNPWGGEDEV